ncbi:MAG: PAS domain-containing protein [Eubacterium ramulus]
MRIKEFNRRAEEVFHTTRQEALKMYLYELIDTVDFEEVYRTHENKLRVKRKMGYVSYDRVGNNCIHSCLRPCTGDH